MNLERKVTLVHYGARVIGGTSLRLRRKGRIGPTVESTNGWIEMNSMVDALCAGASWLLREDTRLICNAYPSKEDYKVVKDILIGTCTMLVEGKGGRIYSHWTQDNIL